MKTKNLLLAAALFVCAFSLQSQQYNADTEKTSVKWTGEKVTGEHFGYVDLKSGTFIVKNNKIVSGEFVINLVSITNEDIESDEYNKKLVGHLKSDDFFSVEKYPTSTLVVKESTPFKDGKTTVKGDLTIKGITKPISFDAKKLSDSKYEAKIVIDRTKYNVKYGSGKFFDNLGDKMIYDDFTLDIVLIAEKK